MKTKYFLLSLLLFTAAVSSFTYSQQETKWSARIADSYIERHPAGLKSDSLYNKKWNYELGTFLEGIRQLWKKSGEEKYFRYLKDNMDLFVQPDGSIRTYRLTEFNIDMINSGRQVLALFKETKDQKYKNAADTLYKQLQLHPRTKSNGYWHKKIYPYQMWLDGLYMGQPFKTEYSVMFNLNNFDDIVHQFTLIEKQTKDKKTGLLYHAWDESKSMKWADPVTGRSPHFWGRAIGWYMMAIVDVLDYLPKNHPGRRELIRILKDEAGALMKVRDKNGLWYQVLDQGPRKGNYHEASATLMFAYSFAKGASKGYLDKKYLKEAKFTFDGVIKELATIDDKGHIDLHHTCGGAGLGGNPYRDGSYEYYVNEKQRVNDLKGMGPFIMLAVELEKAGLM